MYNWTMNRWLVRFLDCVFLLLVAGVVIWVAQNRLEVRDWLFLRNYQPSAQIAQLATDAGMSDTGRRLFYRGDPQLVDKTAINQACGADIIGCTDEKDRIYMLQEDKPSDHQEIVVTAAHEMLHMAYRRLNKAGLAAVDPLIQQNAEQLGSGDIAKEAQRLTDSDQLLDEEHSLLGTEYSPLSAELETYYGRYFTDRQKVLDAYAASK